jgi:hypothetical protein
MTSGVVLYSIELRSLELVVAGALVGAVVGVDGSGIAREVGVEPPPAGISVLYGGTMAPSAP